MPDDLVTIGDAARRLGVTVSTLRYWEERGLVTPTTRRAGKRCYGPGPGDHLDQRERGCSRCRGSGPGSRAAG